MKKIIVIALISIMMIVAVACSGNSTDYQNTTHEIENETTTMPENEQNTTENTVETTEPTETETTEPENKDFTIKLSFAGDMMLASYKDQTTSGSFNEYSNNNPPEYFLEKVKHIFETDDFTIGNLENVFSDKKLTEISKSGDRVFWFKSKTSNVNILTSSSVEGVSLANNHTNDYGSQGKQDTIDTVTNAGLKYGLDSEIMYFEKNGFTVAVICHGLWGEYQADNIIKLIKTAEEKSDYQIVFYHGGTEKIHEPEQWKIRASRKLVDNGADLVIGNHPHVLQPREVYNGVEIIYSLGNFCYGGHSAPENRTIIYQMELTIDENLVATKSQSTIIPCYVYTGNRNNYQPTPIEDEVQKQKVLDFIDGKVKSPV